MRTDNMMRIYLGDEYTGDSLINFCRYWIKGIKNYASYATSDEWRVENDLDCLYYDGNLKADTLMSAWTPIKWVADFINRNSVKLFWKPNERNGYDLSDLELLVADREKYLPSDNEMVMLLDTFLELAELPCNYILLQDGFRSGVIAQEQVIPLIPGLHPLQGKWLYDKKEIKAALYYMVRLLSQRKQRLEAVVK